MTKISSLRKVPKTDRAAELSSVAAMFLPNFSYELPKSEVNEELLKEVQENFKFSPASDMFSNAGDSRNPAVARIQNALFNEIRDSVISKEAISGVRDRLGHKGILASSLYDVQFPKGYEIKCGSANLSKPLVTAVIKEADSVEHLTSGFEGLPGIQRFSLFLRQHPTIKDCSILVLTERRSAKLAVQGAWHIFHKLLGSDISERPIKILERLAQRYGAPFKFLGQSEAVKFVLDKQIPVEQGLNEDWVKLETKERVDGVFSFAVSHGTVKCAFGFAIKAEEYIDDMKRSGLKGKLKSVPLGSQEFSFST
jgi:hypothetical protein